MFNWKKKISKKDPVILEIAGREQEISTFQVANPIFILYQYTNDEHAKRELEEYDDGEYNYLIDCPYYTDLTFCSYKTEMELSYQAFLTHVDYFRNELFYKNHEYIEEYFYKKHERHFLRDRDISNQMVLSHCQMITFEEFERIIYPNLMMPMIKSCEKQKYMYNWDFFDESLSTSQNAFYREIERIPFIDSCISNTSNDSFLKSFFKNFLCVESCYGDSILRGLLVLEDDFLTKKMSNDLPSYLAVIRNALLYPEKNMYYFLGTEGYYANKGLSSADSMVFSLF